MINAIIYSRVSSESERQDTQRQTSELKEYANRMGYNVIEIYEEKVSGFKKNEQRPIFSKMLDDINTNQIDKVLVWELSRIGRSVLQSLQNIQTLRSEHGRTITAYKCQSSNKNWYHYYLCTKPRCQRYRVDWAHEQIKKLLDKISFTAGMVKVYKSQLESLIDRDDVTRKTEIKRLETEIETCKTRQLNLQNSFLDCGISSSDFNEMKIRIESELNDKQIKLERLKSTKSPFKLYLNKTLPMIENLSVYWDKSDGKTKQKILGCIFTEKFENFDFESCNNIFTPEIESIMLASKVLKSGKKRQEVKNDLLSNMAPPLGLEPRTL